MAVRTDPIDWGITARVARTVAGAGPTTTPAYRDEVKRDLKSLSHRSDQLVRGFTGLDPVEAMPEPLIVDRAGWIDANITSFRALVEPLTEKFSANVPPTLVTRALVGPALGAQVGVLLGYLAQKVLGQYDLMLSSGGAGRVYYVGPNIVGSERRLGLDPKDFRLWIALHEVTHRTQFNGVPWLRDRVRGLIERSLLSMEIDPARIREIVDRGRELLLGGPSAWKRANIMTLLLSEKQRAVLEEVQALMTVVEGHGTFVMNRVGQREIAGYLEMKGAFDARHTDTHGAERVFQRAIGMDMKYEQYSLGEKFCNVVADEAGVGAVNMLWADDGVNMPTLEEMRDPAAWMQRVGA